MEEKSRVKKGTSTVELYIYIRAQKREEKRREEKDDFHSRTNHTTSIIII